MHAAPNREPALALLCVAAFTVALNTFILSPLLPQISGELGVQVALGGLLVASFALVAGVGALWAGPIIDRLGHRPVVVAGMFTVACATVASAVAPNFGALLAARAVAGLGVAGLMPAVLTAVGDYFPYQERGRAMARVIAANQLATILGLPLGGMLAGLVSWRWTFVLLAGLGFTFAVLLAARLPVGRRSLIRGGQDPGARQALSDVLGDGRSAAALLSNYLATGCFFALIIYVGAYFHAAYDTPNWALGLLNMVVGLGVLAGSSVGGDLADRLGKRPVVLGAGVASAAFVALLTSAARWEPLAIACLGLFAAAYGARATGHQAWMTELSPRSRGTVMSLNYAGREFGAVTGAFLGGSMIASAGYTYLGPAAGLLGLGSAVIVWARVHETDLTQPAPLAALDR